MFMYFYRDLRSNFYRKMLEFNYYSKGKSKNAETVASCDETLGSADGFIIRKGPTCLFVQKILRSSTS